MLKHIVASVIAGVVLFYIEHQLFPGNRNLEPARFASAPAALSAQPSTAVIKQSPTPAAQTSESKTDTPSQLPPPDDPGVSQQSTQEPSPTGSSLEPNATNATEPSINAVKPPVAYVYAPTPSPPLIPPADLTQPPHLAPPQQPVPFRGTQHAAFDAQQQARILAQQQAQLRMQQQLQLRAQQQAQWQAQKQAQLRAQQQARQQAQVYAQRPPARPPQSPVRVPQFPARPQPVHNQ